MSAAEPTQAEKRKPRTRKPTRGDRWREAARNAVAALEILSDVQGEYQDWHDNIEDRFSGTATYEKLDTIVGLDIGGALDTATEAEGADLPLGFGRD
jgi:hypothetical protein